MRSACASRSGPGTKGRKSSFNLRRWTVNLRRPGRARNEGSTGPKRLGDTRYTFYQEPTVLLRPSAPQCPNTHGMIRPEELRGNSHIRACAALRQAFPWSLEPAGTRIRLDLPPLTSHSFCAARAPPLPLRDAWCRPAPRDALGSHASGFLRCADGVVAGTGKSKRRRMLTPQAKVESPTFTFLSRRKSAPLQAEFSRIRNLCDQDVRVVSQKRISGK